MTHAPPARRHRKAKDQLSSMSGDTAEAPTSPVTGAFRPGAVLRR